jgi:hypothetical protein
MLINEKKKWQPFLNYWKIRSLIAFNKFLGAGFVNTDSLYTVSKHCKRLEIFVEALLHPNCTGIKF